jgi:hypothetical protein
VYALVQRLADLAADAEGQPRRTVPRLADDTALPHQVAVITRDLLSTGSAPALAAGADAVAATARDLA